MATSEEERVTSSGEADTQEQSVLPKQDREPAKQTTRNGTQSEFVKNISYIPL